MVRLSSRVALAAGVVGIGAAAVLASPLGASPSDEPDDDRDRRDMAEMHAQMTGEHDMAEMHAQMTDRYPEMGRMHEQMTRDNPEMARMHERMMGEEHGMMGG